MKVPPRQTVIFREVHMYDPKFSPGTAFVLFCNEPGHYEQGEHAGLVVKSPAVEDKRPLDFRTISLNGDKGGMLAVVDGQLRLVNSRSAWTEWTLRETDKGWTIQALLSREEARPRFLSVDAEGKIGLVSELGDGCYWKLTRKGDRMAPITEALASGDADRIVKAETDRKAVDAAVAKAKADIERFKGEDTSIMGLEKPLFELRNPGIISIPLGFLAVILGSLLYRDKRAEDLWDEVYVRQTTGILATKAQAH